MFTCQKVGFSGKLDSKGRITVPASIREKLGLESGDSIRVSVGNAEIRRKQVSSFGEAKAFIDSFPNAESFSFDGETVEVVLRE